MSDILDFDDDSSNNDVLANIGAASSEVKAVTPLLTVDFHTHMVNDNAVGGTAGLLIRNVFNALADQLCQAIARDIHEIQVTVQGREAIGNDTTVLPSKMFDAQGMLKGEYAKTRTEAQCVRAQTLFAQLVAHRETLMAWIDEHDRLLPNHEMQYAFVTNANATMLGIQPGRIVDPKDAIRFRLDTNPNRLGIKKTAQSVAARKAATQGIAGMSAEQLLAI